MTAPKRSKAPKKPTKAAESKTTPQEEQPVEEAIIVDKEAMAQALSEEVNTVEEQAQKIKELQEALKAAEEKAGNSANIGTQEFKLRPDKDDNADFFYFEINWHPKRSDSDEEFVTMGVNGKMMIWPRNRPTVIRSDYLEVADNAFVPKFKQLPGEDRKEIGGLKPYTYTINRQISEEEYMRRKKEGDKALREDLASKGTPV